ncbi:Stigma-specific protein [Parasponia andersonii]|uniref:Stigma-specific protein n=1 Tax=Parasponia andersonii TaxID=3476 RepID=A0A2P5DCV1_PARAD|nr:Stigma-specific protein [Parasponia andersonii]
MANVLIKTSTILTVIIPLILLSILQNSQLAISTSKNDIDDQYVEDDNDDDDNDESYILDESPSNVRSRSRFLASYIIKKGTHCDPVKYNICNGVPANKGKSLLYCCKAHCRNVLGDRNNCGRCGQKCKFGERCCNGSCTNVLFNKNHCGKCDKQCKKGVACDYGYCGYA